VRNIGERLAENHEVTVATTDPTGKLPREEVINSVRVFRFKSWAPNESYYVSNTLRNYLGASSSKFDVVHAHSYHAFPALYAAQTKGKNRLFFTSHYHGSGHTFFRSLLHVPYKWIGMSIFEKADKTICVSSFEKSLLLKDFHIREGDVEVVPNGVNLDEFRFLKRQGKQNYRTILTIGRLERYKGVQYLILSLTQLNENVILDIVGKGPLETYLRKLVSNLKLQKRVIFERDLLRADLLQRYADSDLFVSLSSLESYGLTVAEALAAGTPCIVANASALSEWIDNINCYGIDDPINADQLVALINKVMGKSVHAQKIPDWNDVVQHLERLYIA